MGLRVEYVPISDIKPYQNNARTHTELDLKSIQDSIREFGFNDPIGVWHGEIVEGHGRWMAAQALNMTTVPIIRLDELNDEQRRAYMLAHNKTAELSSWDEKILEAELDNIYEIDMSLFGFDISEYEPFTPDKNEEEDPYADIDKLDTHYGVPYQGNKSRIADIIISLLPEGKRLVDLFGGGRSNYPLRDAFREMGSLPVQRSQQFDHRPFY